MSTDTTPNQSEQMMKTQNEMNKNREDYTLLMRSHRQLEAFEAKTEEGKKKKVEEMKKVTSAIQQLDIEYRSLLARLEIEAIEFIMNPNTTEPKES